MYILRPFMDEVSSEERVKKDSYEMGENIAGGNFPGENFPGGEFDGCELSGWEFS